MKKFLAVICILMTVLCLCLISCGEQTSCKDMLGKVINYKSITVKYNGETVFIQDNDCLYWKYVYGNAYDEYYFCKDKNGTNYVYYKEYGENWVKDPMTAADYKEYVDMVTNAYGVEEDIKTVLEYIHNNFDSVLIETEDGYSMPVTAFDTIKNLNLTSDSTSLTLTCYMYNEFYRIEFFSIDSTSVDLPENVKNAPIGDVSMP